MYFKVEFKVEIWFESYILRERQTKVLWKWETTLGAHIKHDAILAEPLLGRRLSRKLWVQWWELPFFGRNYAKFDNNGTLINNVAQFWGMKYNQMIKIIVDAMNELPLKKVRHANIIGLF